MVVESQSFAVEPRSLNSHAEEDEQYYANIHFDKRVHRGSNYSRPQAHTTSPTQPMPVRRFKRAPASTDPFSIPVPKPKRPSVDLLSHLVEQPRDVIEKTAGSQTAAFRPRKDRGVFLAVKTGRDAETHIEEGDLFDFDEEVKPLADVLVAKTIEQAVMETEEELEQEAFVLNCRIWILCIK